MSIGRVSMMEFSSKEEADNSEKLYDKIRAEAFPTLELVVNIRTGPTSVMSVAIYPSYESAASNLEARKKFQDEIEESLKDSFFHEGEVLKISPDGLFCRRGIVIWGVCKVQWRDCMVFILKELFKNSAKGTYLFSARYPVSDPRS